MSVVIVLGVVSLDVFEPLRKTLVDENQDKHREEADVRDQASFHERSPRVSRPTVAGASCFSPDEQAQRDRWWKGLCELEFNGLEG